MPSLRGQPGYAGLSIKGHIETPRVRFACYPASQYNKGVRLKRHWLTTRFERDGAAPINRQIDILVTRGNTVIVMNRVTRIISMENWRYNGPTSFERRNMVTSLAATTFGMYFVCAIITILCLIVTTINAALSAALRPSIIAFRFLRGRSSGLTAAHTPPPTKIGTRQQVISGYSYVYLI